MVYSPVVETIVAEEEFMYPQSTGVLIYHEANEALTLETHTCVGPFQDQEEGDLAIGARVLVKFGK